MDNWNSDTWPIQFLESEQAFFLDSTLKEHAEGILTFCIRELLAYNPHFPDNVTSSQFKAVLTEKLPKLNLPLPIIQKTPELLNDFFTFIGMSGIYPPAQYWTSFIETEGDEFRRRFRIDGSFKGETQKRSDAKINRNEPCPCGSGKKYKKCCGK